jgi:molybdate transport system substrate-binding protein
LSRLHLDPKPVVETEHADGVLTAIAAGRADAGIVYATSFANAAADVVRIDVPEADNTPVLYSISATAQAKEPRGAAAFRAFAIGSEGQRILRECGFLPIGAKLP